VSDRNWLETLGWGQEELSDLRNAAYLYIRQGIYDVALTFFDALSVLAPPIPYDLQTIGALYLQTGNGLKSLDYLDQALKLDPNHLPTQLNRAKALFMLGYKRQGLIQAMELEKCSDPQIAAAAAALTLSYR
jgi:tetratricopeptide (TPR) repeat protein